MSNIPAPIQAWIGTERGWLRAQAIIWEMVFSPEAPECTGADVRKRIEEAYEAATDHPADAGGR